MIVMGSLTNAATSLGMIFSENRFTLFRIMLEIRNLAAAFRSSQSQKPAQPSSLFNHLVGGCEQRRRNVEAERFRRPGVDHHLELGRQLHRKVGRLLAPENSACIDCRLPKQLNDV